MSAPDSTTTSDGIDPLFALRAGALLGGAAVALGAFGAHGLQSRVTAGTLDPHLLDVFKTGVQYHFYHALAILASAFGGPILWGGPAGRRAVTAWLVGIGVFSGSLYLMTFTGQRWLGAITPIGGVAFILGWIFAATGRR